MPRRVFARHLMPRQLGPNRVSTPIVTLPFANLIISPLMGCYDTINFIVAARDRALGVIFFEIIF